MLHRGLSMHLPKESTIIVSKISAPKKSNNGLEAFQRVVQRLNLIRIDDTTLASNLIHGLHDDDALFQSEALTLELSITQTTRGLVCFPEHAVASGNGPLYEPRVLQRGLMMRDNSVARGLVGRPKHLDFAQGALDPDAGSCRTFLVGIGGDLYC